MCALGSRLMMCDTERRRNVLLAFRLAAGPPGHVERGHQQDNHVRQYWCRSSFPVLTLRCIRRLQRFRERAWQAALSLLTSSGGSRPLACQGRAHPNIVHTDLLSLCWCSLSYPNQILHGGFRVRTFGGHEAAGTAMHGACLSPSPRCVLEQKHCSRGSGTAVMPPRITVGPVSRGLNSCSLLQT